MLFPMIDNQNIILILINDILIIQFYLIDIYAQLQMVHNCYAQFIASIMSTSTFEDLTMK